MSLRSSTFPLVTTPFLCQRAPSTTPCCHEAPASSLANTLPYCVDSTSPTPVFHVARDSVGNHCNATSTRCVESRTRPLITLPLHRALSRHARAVLRPLDFDFRLFLHAISRPSRRLGVNPATTDLHLSLRCRVGCSGIVRPRFPTIPNQA